MDRMACVDVPALPLQLLMRGHPDLVDQPVAVLERDTPQGEILWVNAPAQRCGVLTGMSYATGLALAHDLRGVEVTADEIAEGVVAITRRLRRFTPHIEPSQDHPGVFWLDASGLQPLFASLEIWAHKVQRHLRRSDFQGRVVVGFTRFGTYATTKAGRGRRPPEHVTVFRNATAEQQAARAVPLGRLDIDPELRDVLDKLGVRTVGAFVDLPAAGIRKRFGRDAHRLHRHAAGDLLLPLQPLRPVEPLTRHTDLDTSETDVHRLLFLIKHDLDPLVSKLATRQEALAALEIRLRLDTSATAPRAERVEQIRPAEPTLDARQILNLVLLRLEGHALPAGVTEIALTITPARASREQLRLFQQHSTRDLRAADRAVARIRAEFGDGTVVRAYLTDGHLPEATFDWQPLAHVVRPTPTPVSPRPLVRRFFRHPRRLPARLRHEPDGWMLRGAQHGHVIHLHGPYVVSGGWWRTPVLREYYYARTRDDAWSWIYYDRHRRAWFLHGEVE
ncbi:MAG TPA: DNA repair nucleotidyltransferase [Acidobacteria bacterium]|nr:DNA repair nucleotidyltransferase [Acidobacteriota bacterium]HCE01975.1 DNA repair nucleotidyltransferase [Acidobacteriota bacterium]